MRREQRRDVIRRAFEDGMHPRQSAVHIRSLVGLTRRQAQAVDNLRRTLTAGGVTEPQAQARAIRYGERLLKQRAENIARTETIRAGNMGQQLLWQQGVERGLIDPRRTRRFWILTIDDRLCPFCEAMDSQEVDMDELFQSPRGLAPVLTPPLHPSCRCAVGLRFLRG